MERSERNFIATSLAIAIFVSWFASCGAPSGNTNLTSVNANAGIANSVSNSNLNINAAPAGATVDAKEPDQYQANIKLSLQTMGPNQQPAGSVPTLGATVARSGADRVMQFAMPNGEKVIYLDKGGVNYLILPNRKQYAELTKEALGFEIRRMMMPAEIVSQVRAQPGVVRAGEEQMNGRTVVKYTYQTVANTQTQAGNVQTESYMLIDKDTGLPLRSETVAQTQSGANVNGVSGVHVVTEMTDINTSPDPNMFMLPSDYQKIDPAVVRAQVTAIFQVLGTIVGNMMNQNAAPAANANTLPSPAASPR
jgi:hypothetical protein